MVKNMYKPPNQYYTECGYSCNPYFNPVFDGSYIPALSFDGSYIPRSNIYEENSSTSYLSEEIYRNNSNHQNPLALVLGLRKIQI